MTEILDISANGIAWQVEGSYLKPCPGSIVDGQKQEPGEEAGFEIGAIWLSGSDVDLMNVLSAKTVERIQEACDEWAREKELDFNEDEFRE